MYIPLLLTQFAVTLRGTSGEKRNISGINRLIRWRFQSLRHFVTPPLLLTPHPVMLRGILNNIGAEAKGIYISHSPPVFCAAKYRGSARRARGLIYTIKYCFATQGRRLNTFYLTGKNHTTKESRNTPCLTLRTAKD